MQTFAHYALLGSLIAAAAGVLVLTAVTVKYGIKRRALLEGDDESDAAELSRRQRTVRLADTMVVVCFAVAAGLGVVGMTRHARVAAILPGVEGALAERVQALERRIASAELQLQARAMATTDARPWEERIAHIESRLGSMEDRAANAESLSRERREEKARTVPVAVPVPRRTPAVTKSIATAPPTASPRHAPASASPRLAPRDEGGIGPDVKQEASASPPPLPTVTTPPPPIATAPPPPPIVAAPVLPPREASKPRVQTPPADPSLADKVRNDWETVKREAQRSGAEWQEGWRQFRRLFTD